MKIVNIQERREDKKLYFEPPFTFTFDEAVLFYRYFRDADVRFASFAYTDKKTGDGRINAMVSYEKEYDSIVLSCFDPKTQQVVAQTSNQDPNFYNIGVNFQEFYPNPDNIEIFMDLYFALKFDQLRSEAMKVLIDDPETVETRKRLLEKTEPFVKNLSEEMDEKFGK